MSNCLHAAPAAAAATSGYEGVSRYASEPLPRELQMGDVFPGKTRGPRAEKQPYVPDPLPKGVQSMGDVLPGMTKPARPVRKRQEPGRWDGVGEKPSPKPCQDCRPPQSVRRVAARGVWVLRWAVNKGPIVLGWASNGQLLL